MWEKNAKIAEEVYGMRVDWDERFYICPECGEPVYEWDWTDEALEEEFCPVCGFIHDGAIQIKRRIIMFTAYWEVVNEDREDYLDNEARGFSNFTDAIDWLGAKGDDIDYYCVITDETGRVVYTGWMP